MKDIKTELCKYAESTMKKNKWASEAAKKDWMFGAVDFAHFAGIITKEEAEELYEKYELI